MLKEIETLIINNSIHGAYSKREKGLLDDTVVLKCQEFAILPLFSLRYFMKMPLEHILKIFDFECYFLTDWPSKLRKGKITTRNEMGGLHPGRSTSSWRSVKETFSVVIYIPFYIKLGLLYLPRFSCLIYVLLRNHSFSCYNLHF